MVKYLLNEATTAESEVVNNWISEDAANKEYYNQLKTIWNSSKKLAAASNVDENIAWQTFQHRIATAPLTEIILKPNGFGWMKIAAAIALLVSIGVVTYFSVSKKNTPEIAFVKTVGNILTDTLTDGSVITLNKNSSISYPRRFNGKTRPVTLTGEAFFSVAPDTKKPFVITVNNVQVTVVGTSFNINSKTWNTEVIVETGIVTVTKGENTITLTAGEKLQIPADNSIGTKQPVNDKLYNYYRSKEFVCGDTPLWKLVQVLNEAYGTNISIGRKELNNYKLNTTFNNESLDKILEIIHLTFDIEVVKQNGQIILN